MWKIGGTDRVSPPSGYNPNFRRVNEITEGKGGDWDAMYRHVTVSREWASNFSHDATRNPQEFRGTRPRYSNLQRRDRSGFRLRDETRARR